MLIVSLHSAKGDVLCTYLRTPCRVVKALRPGWDDLPNTLFQTAENPTSSFWNVYKSLFRSIIFLRSAVTYIVYVGTYIRLHAHVYIVARIIVAIDANSIRPPSSLRLCLSAILQLRQYFRRHQLLPVYTKNLCVDRRRPPSDKQQRKHPLSEC